MDDFVATLLTIVVGLIAVPVAVFFIEVTAATATTLARRFGASAKEVRGTLRPRIAVLITAHNESVGLTPILEDVKQQVQPDDRILVVADNCTDDTASIASAHGVQVIERRDMTKRDKGFALDFGIRHLALDPPEILIMLDADCRLADNAIYELAMTCAATCRPVQALYRMLAPSDSSNNLQVAEFTWRVKNWLRPLGLKALGLPCQLMGTGMAFPWDAIRRVDLASNWHVEDLKLGIDLASQGRLPLFCPTARVTSQFGASATAIANSASALGVGAGQDDLERFPAASSRRHRGSRLAGYRTCPRFDSPTFIIACYYCGRDARLHCSLCVVRFLVDRFQPLRRYRNSVFGCNFSGVANLRPRPYHSRRPASHCTLWCRQSSPLPSYLF